MSAGGIAQTASLGSIRSQVKTMRAEHAMYADYTQRNVEWFERFNPAASEDIPLQTIRVTDTVEFSLLLSAEGSGGERPGRQSERGTRKVQVKQKLLFPAIFLHEFSDFLDFALRSSGPGCRLLEPGDGVLQSLVFNHEVRPRTSGSTEAMDDISPGSSGSR